MLDTLTVLLPSLSGGAGGSWAALRHNAKVQRPQALVVASQCGPWAASRAASGLGAGDCAGDCAEHGHVLVELGRRQEMQAEGPGAQRSRSQAPRRRAGAPAVPVTTRSNSVAAAFRSCSCVVSWSLDEFYEATNALVVFFGTLGQCLLRKTAGSD